VSDADECSGTVPSKFCFLAARERSGIGVINHFTSVIYKSS